MNAVLQAQTVAIESSPAVTAATNIVLQRSCACGGHAGVDGECAGCRCKRLQRSATQTSAPAPEFVPPIVHEVLRSSGRPLDDNTREFMESRFNQDFSHVRVHTDARAARSAREVNANAYTVGNNVVFAPGQYLPTRESGQALLAHELAHVVHQRHAMVRLQNANDVTTRMFESDADRAASAVTHERPVQLRATGSSPVILFQRHPRRGSAPRRSVAPSSSVSGFSDLSEEQPDLARKVYVLQADFEDLVHSLPRHSDWLRRGEMIDLTNRSIRTYGRMRNAQFTSQGIIQWLRLILRSLGSISSLFGIPPGGGNSELGQQISLVAERLQDVWSSDFVQAGVELRDEDRRTSARTQDHSRLTQRLLTYIREHWVSLRDAPSIASIPIDNLIRRGLRRQRRTNRNAVNDYITEIQSTNQRLWQFLNMIHRNPRLLQRHENDFRRALSLAVGGEWADVLPPTADEVTAGELTGDTETALEAEVIGIGADTLITMIPFLDQLGDARDSSAHIYALLNLDGRHADEVSNPMRWFGLTMTMMGLIPTIGSFLKGIGKIIKKVLTRSGDVVTNIVRRVSRPVVIFIQRYSPGALELAETLLRRVTNGWNGISTFVHRAWNNLSGSLSSFISNRVLQLTEFGRSLQRRWQPVQNSAQQMIEVALARSRELFEPVFNSVIRMLRRGGEIVTAAIPKRLLNFAGNVSTGAAAFLLEARRRARNLRDFFSLPESRMARLDAAITELDEVQFRLQRAMQDGSSDTIDQLSRRAEELTTDIERRLSRSVGVDGTVDIPSRQSGVSEAEVLDPNSPQRLMDDGSAGRTGDTVATGVVEKSAHDALLIGRGTDVSTSQATSVLRRPSSSEPITPSTHRPHVRTDDVEIPSRSSTEVAGRVPEELQLDEIFPRHPKIEIGGHTYRFTEGGVFRCSHCRLMSAEELIELFDEYPNLRRMFLSDEDVGAAIRGEEWAIRERMERMVEDAGRQQAITERIDPERVLEGARSLDVPTSLARSRPSIGRRIRATIQDIESEGLNIDVGIQQHNHATHARRALGVSGSQVQSAHIAATSLFRELPGYSRSRANTVLLDSAAHTAFDQHWLRWVSNRRRALRAFGETEFTAPIHDVLDAQRRAVRQIPNLTPEQRGTIEWLLEIEIRNLLQDLPDDLETIVSLPAVLGS